MSTHDRQLAGYRKEYVTVVCSECTNEWSDTLETEYGMSWLTDHEECPECGADSDSLLVGSECEPDYDYLIDCMQEERWND